MTNDDKEMMATQIEHEPNEDGSPYVAWLMVRDDFLEHVVGYEMKKETIENTTGKGGVR